MADGAETISASQYVSRRYFKSLLGRSWRLLREFEFVGPAYLLSPVLWLVVGSFLRRPLFAETITPVADGFGIAVASLAVARVTGRSTASRAALLRGIVVGTVLAVVFLILLPLVAVAPLGLVWVASELGVGGLVFAILALCGVLGVLYLVVSLALVIPATLVDRVRPMAGLRRGWTVAKTARLQIMLVYAGGLGIFTVSTIAARFVVAAVGPSTLGPTGVTAIRLLRLQPSALFLTLSLAFLYVDRVSDLEAIA